MKLSVIGPTSIDVKAYTTEFLAPGRTAFGHIYISPGGPGRNIAENLGRLSISCSLFSVVGKDFIAQAVIDYTKAAGVDVSHILFSDTYNTSTFASFGQSRELEPLIVYNREVAQDLIPDYLSANHDALKDSTAFVVHADPYSLRSFIAFRSASIDETVPVALSIKVEEITSQFLSFLPSATWTFMNRDEASVFGNIAVESIQDAKNVLPRLLASGCKVGIITLGRDGCVVGNDNNMYHIGGVVCEEIDQIGAGDAFIAGFVMEILSTKDIVASALFASAMGALTVMSPNTVRFDISSNLVRTFLQQHSYNVTSLL